MEEYKIDENTTYIDDGSKKIIKYAKQDGSSLVVSFRAYDVFSTGGDDDHIGFPDSLVKAEIYNEKPVKCEEKQTEEKKLSKFEQVKNKLLSKILAKKSNSNNSETTTPKETFSKEVLLNEDFYNSNHTLDGFLANPIQLEPEHKSISEVLESARQTIITEGYRLKKEAEKQEEARNAEKIKADSNKKIDFDNKFARKLKDFGIGR